ncbi:hypothetical protein AB0B25_23815 [Nocardia sp. NPDC049190]|uniref:FixH family protein n=1 Tax=Nocardia sp. NPDC049190 TaxID=3155650 RepID=UPI0033F4E203
MITSTSKREAVTHLPRSRRVVAAIAGIAAAVLVIVYPMWPSTAESLVFYTGSPSHVVTLTVDRPRVGDTDIEIAITDRAGSPVEHAVVQIQPIAPLMGNAGPSATAAYTGSGRYCAAAVPLMMTGPWELWLSIDGLDRLMLPLWISG